MSDINIFTSNDGPQEMRCTVTNGAFTASKFCLKKNAKDCFWEITETLPPKPANDSDEALLRAAQQAKPECCD